MPGSGKGPYHKRPSAKVRALLKKGHTNKEVRVLTGRTSAFISDVKYRMNHPLVKARLQAAYKQRKLERSFGL
jgi:hypothetical protein